MEQILHGSLLGRSLLWTTGRRSLRFVRALRPKLRLVRLLILLLRILLTAELWWILLLRPILLRWGLLLRVLLWGVLILLLLERHLLSRVLLLRAGIAMLVLRLSRESAARVWMLRSRDFILKVLHGLLEGIEQM